MIWEILIILGVIGAIVLLARRLPDLNEDGQPAFWNKVIAGTGSFSRNIFQVPVNTFKSLAKIGDSAARSKEETGDDGENDLMVAEQLFSGKDYEKAEKFYLRVLRRDPRNDKIYCRLGVIYLMKKHFRNSRDAFEMAIKIDPTVSSRYFNLGLAYEKMNNLKKASENFQRAFDLEPTSEKYYKMAAKYNK